VALSYAQPGGVNLCEKVSNVRKISWSLIVENTKFQDLPAPVCEVLDLLQLSWRYATSTVAKASLKSGTAM